MHELDLILVLMAAVVVLATVANRVGVPYPIFLIAGGLVLALIPGLPEVNLDPEAVFLLFLPPILFSAAYFTDWRAFKANRRPRSRAVMSPSRNVSLDATSGGKAARRPSARRSIGKDRSTPTTSKPSTARAAATLPVPDPI